MIADNWTDYKIIATGNGQKLERWGDVILLRPDPQVIWPASFDLASYKGLNALYKRSSSGGGQWKTLKHFPDEWTINYGKLRFGIKPMGFKHVGLFPEQAANWDLMTELIKSTKAKSAQDHPDPKRGAFAGHPSIEGNGVLNGREIKVLNLFAYTGGASVACAAAGASVTHVDAAKGMIERAGENTRLSGVKGIRLIVDDCFKFVSREIKRGNKYDAVIMDPPSFGRGPTGETWKIEDNLFDLVKLTAGVLSNNPLFFLINSYTTGLQPIVIDNILNLALKGFKGTHKGYELALPTDEGILLPCGCSGLWQANQANKK